MTTAGLVLAAGGGTRFGSPKAPVVVDGERLVDRSVRCLRDAGCNPIVVVLGAWVGEVSNAEVVVNANWPDGMGSSLQAGLDALQEAGDIDAVVVTLVDLPGMTSAAVRRVVEADGEIVVATYGTERGHPVKLARRHWAEVSAVATGDEGARRFLAGRRDLTFVEVADVAVGTDLDSPPAG